MDLTDDMIKRGWVKTPTDDLSKTRFPFMLVKIHDDDTKSIVRCRTWCFDYTLSYCLYLSCGWLLADFKTLDMATMGWLPYGQRHVILEQNDKTLIANTVRGEMVRKLDSFRTYNTGDPKIKKLYWGLW